MGKGSKPTIGYWYKPAFHVGLGIGPIDAYREFRGGDKTAWAGNLTASGTITINAPHLWGGEKDQGGIVGDVDVMFGQADQEPNPYLISTFGPQQPAWRGMATLAFKGGRYGAMNPYPHPASHKIVKILKGWDGDVCWYPEKAAIPLGQESATSIIDPQATGWKYKQVAGTDDTDYSTEELDDSGWATGAAPFGGWEEGYDGDSTGLTAPHTYDPAFAIAFASAWTPNTRLWLRRKLTLPAAPVGDLTIKLYVEDHCTIYINGNEVLTTPANPDGGNGGVYPISVHHLHQGENTIAIRCDDEADSGGFSVVYADFSFVATAAWGLFGMNPAHALYYARTHREIGRDPIANINDASYRAAADKLYAERFGICTEYDPSAESLLEFEQRICNLIGGGVNRSLVDGQYYLDLARGDYVVEDLPILTDDDILSFAEQPSILDNATNSVSVKYFDPQRKESIITPPVQALALIDSFGTIHQAKDYPEIPLAALAAQIALRDLLASVTPTRAFDLATKRTPYDWRPNTYFRLQAPKRGIADMVCLLGSKGTGTLKSGAVKIATVQDIYSLPDTSYVEVEEGVDTRPPQTAVPIVLQMAFEAPYIEVAGTLTRADLAALPEETGYLLAVAADPAQSRDYTMMVAPDGGAYVEASSGAWCPTALVVEAAGISDTEFTLASASRLAEVQVGSAALYGDEICRVDAIDADALTVTLARGCADTVPAEHAAGSRLWFYDGEVAFDTTEYTDGETVDVKLLTNTGSQQLAEGLATAMEVTFDQRQFRPYPPGLVRVNGEASPTYLFGEVTVTWAHRDRVLQADQLIDHEMASIGPEAGTTGTVRWYLDDVLVQTHSALAGTSQAYTPAADGLLRIEVESERGGLVSWQKHTREFAYTVVEVSRRVTPTGDVRVTPTGDRRVVS